MSTTNLQDRFPDLKYRSIPRPVDHPHYHYIGFQTERVLLQPGHVKTAGRRAFTVATWFERDTPIQVRDGAKLYADIFRPEDECRRVPAIIPWSPYGKTGTGPQNYDFMAPFRAGIPENRTTGYEKFEAPDPAEWVERGYAIVNIDARGAGDSEGFIAMWGQQASISAEADDVHDVIDWVAKQPWCNGSVCMAGNSWLAISQVNFTARSSHPALKALAPWEAYTDPYRDFVGRGGRAHIPGFHKMIEGGFAGPNGVEDMTGMFRTHPMFDDWWEEKRIPVEAIEGDVPMYFLASYSSMLHTRGSFDTFDIVPSNKKWLRVHPYQEWYDLYRPEVNDDLQRYFDFYCKGIDNGWEAETPRIRLSLLGFEDSPAATILERAEKQYPPAGVEMQTLYLDARDRGLKVEAVAAEGEVFHESHHLTESSDFVFHFDGDVELVGCPMLRVWMSCAEHDDMDVVCQIRKVDRDGNLMEQLNYPVPVPASEVPNVNVAKYIGTQGFLRASHAVSKDDLSSRPDRPFYTHKTRQAVSPGSIVALDIPIWPIGFNIKAGEGIMLRISGHDMCLPEVEMARLTEPEDDNVGVHRVHCGGRYSSYLRLPVKVST